MNKSLPKKLNKEPLLEALFEVRFSCSLPASTILPGLLFNKLEGDKKIEQLSVAQIPKALRDADPNLQFAPISRLIWKQFHINIGDKSLSIACPTPYSGWEVFKKTIEKVVNILSETNIIESVERYSIKYVNLIPSNTLEEQVGLLDFDVTIANHKILKEAFQFRIEIREGDLINIITLASSAEVLLPNESIKKGVIVDIDTLVILNNGKLNDILNGLENTRQVNKQKFFNCLTQEAILSLEPDYE